MGGDPFANRVPGEDSGVPTAAWNYLMDMARRDRRQEPGDRRPAAIQYRDRVWVRNDSQQSRSRFHVLGLDVLVFTPDQNLDLFFDEPYFKGVRPTRYYRTQHWDGLWGVLLDALPAGEIGQLLLSGIVPVKLDLTATWHPRADIVINDSTRLRSYPGGAARILWTDRTSTGEKWALVRIGVNPLMTYRGKLTQTLSPGGSAPMTIYYYSGSAYTSDSISETVYAPPEMTTGTFPADKWYRVAWEPQAFRLEIDTREC